MNNQVNAKEMMAAISGRAEEKQPDDPCPPGFWRRRKRMVCIFYFYIFEINFYFRLRMRKRKDLPQKRKKKNREEHYTGLW